jgi:nitronate monooxygenase
MSPVAGPELVAAVSRAGGLGILAALRVAPDELRRQIRQIRALTDRPFGVNLWLHTELWPPVAPETLADDAVRSVQSTLNRFRERLDLEPTLARPAPITVPPAAGFEVLLEERVPVFSTGVGAPSRDMVARCHAHGVKVVAMVATVDDARAVAGAGADVVIAQGGEAGGHRSVGVKPRAPEGVSVGTLALVPQVVDAVRVPVVAAGGIADGRGLAAVLALGAAGALLGTRFVATRESRAAEFWKKRILESDGEGTTLTDAFTGQWARVLRNTFAEEYRASGAPTLPGLLQSSAAQDVFTAAATRQDPEHFHMYAGQGAGLIRDLPGAGDVVEAVVREARAVLAALARRAGLDLDPRREPG